MKRVKKESWDRPRLERTAEILEIPKDVILSAMILKITGRTDVYIENYNHIIEYKEDVLKVQGKNTRVMLSGKKINIEYFTKNAMQIRGKIEEIKYY